MDQEQEQQRYERAQKRVEALKGFYIHATVFVLVNTGLFVINLLTGGPWWFFFPLIGWGIGLGVHALSTFVFGGRLGIGRSSSLPFFGLKLRSQSRISIEWSKPPSLVMFGVPWMCHFPD